jgi:hypothetical protein
MKAFRKHSISFEECSSELEEFKKLLDSKPELEEKKDILPFFEKNQHVAAFIGSYIPDISNPDKIANEYDVFGDFTCDLAVGDSSSLNYLFVEFEDAKTNSLFKQNTRSTPDWSSRLEHGFSQVIDWLWKLNDMVRTDDYESRFGAKYVEVHGLVVIGRDESMEVREKNRLKWRQDHTVINSKKISIITYDQLYMDLKYRLSAYSSK